MPLNSLDFLPGRRDLVNVSGGLPVDFGKKLTRSDKDVLLFQAIRALLSDLPQTNEVTRARKGLDIAIEELTMEQE